jgi:hypothetical protein
LTRYHAMKHTLLGVQMTIQGNTEDQELALSKKLTHITRAFLQCPLSNDDAWQGYTTVYLPAVTYALSATAMKWEHLETLQKQITNAVLPPLGYNRHTPRAIVYATEHFGGLGMRSLPTEQGAQHAIYALSNIRENKSSAATVLTMLEAYSIAVGSTINPLEDNREFPYVKSPWTFFAKQKCKSGYLSSKLPKQYAKMI